MAARDWGVRYVTAEEAARRLGITVGTLYRRLDWPPGDWHKAGGRWHINLDALLRRMSEDEAWREAHRATHVAVQPELRAPVDVRTEPDWSSLPQWLPARTADRLLGGSKGVVADNARRGRIERREAPRKPSARRARGFRTRWLYRTEDVRRVWHRQERSALRRARLGRSFSHWGPRDRADFTSGAWKDVVNSRQAAEILGISIQQVARLCARGRLPAVQRKPGRQGSRLYIPIRAIERLAERPEYACAREMYYTRADVEPQEPEPIFDEETGKVLTQAALMRLDGERREAAKMRRRGIMAHYGLEGARTRDLIEEGDDEEEGRRTEAGHGYVDWVVTGAWPPAAVECRPLRRDFGDHELNHGDFYSTAQVARLLGVCRSAVVYYRRIGRLQGYRLKKHANEAGWGNWWWFYRKEDVDLLQCIVLDRRRARRQAKTNP